MDELPFRIVYCNSELEDQPALLLERPCGRPHFCERAGGWVSDLRHRYPLEVGIWLGDCTLEALRLVAHETLVPRRVEVFTSADHPTKLVEEETRPLSDVRREWRRTYAQALFTQLGTIDFEGSFSGRRESKLAKPSRPVIRCTFVRLVFHEPLEAICAGSSFSNNDPERLRRQHCVGLLALEFYGQDALWRSLNGRPVMRNINLDAAEWALVASGVSPKVIADIARRRVNREERRERLLADEAVLHSAESVESIARCATDAVRTGDFSRAARLQSWSLRYQIASQEAAEKDESEVGLGSLNRIAFCHAWQSKQEDTTWTVNVQDSIRSPPLDAIVRVAANEISDVVRRVFVDDSPAEEEAGDYVEVIQNKKGGNQSHSTGLLELRCRRPLVVTAEPFRTMLDGDVTMTAHELAECLARSEHNESASARLLHWILNKCGATLDGVAEALEQMRSVEVVSKRRQFFGSLDAPSLEDGGMIPEECGSEVVMAALQAALGPLALAYVCQGNPSIRRKVIELVLDGASQVNVHVLAAAADLCSKQAKGEFEAEFPHSKERHCRLLFVAMCTLIEHGLTDPSVEVFTAALRLLFDVFSAKESLQCSATGEPYVEANTSTVGDGDPTRSLPGQLQINFVDDVVPEPACVSSTDHDGISDGLVAPVVPEVDNSHQHSSHEGKLEARSSSYYLRPWRLLREGIHPRQSKVPLREALTALRTLIPSLASRLNENSSIIVRQQAARTLVQLADIPWLGSPIIAAAAMPRVPELNHILLQSQIKSASCASRLVAETVVSLVSSGDEDSESIANRIRLLSVLVAHSGTVADSVLSEDDLVTLAVTAIELDGRRCAIAAASNLLAAVYLKSPNALKNYATCQSVVAIIMRAVDKELVAYGGTPGKHTMLCRAGDAALTVASNAFITASNAAQKATVRMQEAQKRATGEAHQRKLTLERVVRARMIGTAWRKANQRKVRRRIVDMALEIARTGSARATESLRLANAACVSATDSAEKTGIFRQTADSSSAFKRGAEEYSESTKMGIGGPTPAEFDDNDRVGASVSKEKFPSRRTDGKVHPELEMAHSDDERTSTEKKGSCDIQ